MKSAAEWWVRAALSLLPIVFVATAIPHLIDGLAVECAFPVPVYTQMNVALPRNAYASAADALARGMSRDGDRAISQADAEALAGFKRSDVVDLVQNGLSLSPASPRGWTLLAEQLARPDRRRAGEALAVALTLAPSDYLLLGRLERDAGALWDVLPADARQIAVNAAPNLWKFEQLRPYIRPVLGTHDGPHLITSAFWFDPESLRAMNRWVEEQRLEEGKP